MYSLGIDLAGDAHAVTWARSPDVDAPTRIDASGSVPAVVGAAPDGTLRVSASGRTPEHEASGFIDRLGSSDPIIVGTTPYGPEALLAAVLDEVVRISTTELGDTPAAIGVVHDDWDLFRCSLLVEAARVAGVPPDRVVLVPRAAATTAAAEVGAPDGTPAIAAAGGAAIAAATLSDERSRRAGGAAAIGTGLAGAVAASTIGARVLDAGTATAVGAAAGPAGVPLSSGPTGAPAAGPAGAPLTGPAGQPLEGGPTGEPLATAAKASRPRWLTAALAGGAAAVVATVAVVGVTTRGDGETAASPPSATAAPNTTPASDAAGGPAAGGSTTVAVAPASTEPATTMGTTSTSIPATTLPVFALAPFAGDWEMVCEPFLAGDGASAGRWSFEVTGGDTMDVVVQGVDYTTSDCSDAGTVLALQQPMTLRIVGIAPVEGVDAFVTVSNVYGIVALAVSGDQLRIGVGGDQPPTSFEPELTAVRR